MSWTLFSHTKVKAAKEHRCYLCGLAIAKGEHHLRQSGKGDGGVETLRFHSVCFGKTADWDETSWESFCGQAEFRHYELGMKE